MSHRVRSPWAVCRAAQKKYGFSEAKFERCVLKVKARGNPGEKLPFFATPGVTFRLRKYLKKRGIRSRMKPSTAHPGKYGLAVRKFDFARAYALLEEWWPKWLPASTPRQIAKQIAAHTRRERRAERRPRRRGKVNPMRGGPMKPETIARRARERAEAKHRQRADLIRRLEEAARLDPEGGRGIYAEMLRETRAKGNSAPVIWRKRRRGKKTTYFRGPDPRYRTYYVALASFAPPYPAKRRWVVARSMDTLPPTVIGKVAVVSARTKEAAVAEARGRLR